MAGQRLLIFGGTFDPPHRAHIELPADAAERIAADAIVYIPAGQPPHKTADLLSSADHRLAMLRLALADRPGVRIDTFELDRPQVSYTVDTLEHLRRRFGPDTEMRLLIGTDQARAFHRWHRPGRIVELAEPLVMVRPPDNRQTFLRHLPADQRRIWQARLIETARMEMSSSTLRRLLHDQIDHPDLARALAPAVLAYIRAHRLYR